MKFTKIKLFTFAVLLFSVNSFSQTVTQSDTNKVSKMLDNGKTDKMNTIFSGGNHPFKKLNYLGLSVGSEIIYGSLAGAFTPMAGASAMLHFNKKLALGVAGYSTIGDNFTPTSISNTKAYSLNNMYGGFKLEYTPKPDAKVHVSFPLLIGAGSAKLDSAGHKNDMDFVNNKGNHDHDKNGRNNDQYGHEGSHEGDNSYFVIQPGVNVEANLFRFAKIFVGATYRIVPSVSTESSTTATTMPLIKASQLSGVNLSAGIKIGLFDYNLHQAKKHNFLHKRHR